MTKLVVPPMPEFPNPKTEAAITALTALSTELSDLKAELARAREAMRRPRGLEFLDGAIKILDCNPYPPGYAGILGPLRSYLMDLRAALAPEQKGE